MTSEVKITLEEESDCLGSLRIVRELEDDATEIAVEGSTGGPIGVEINDRDEHGNGNLLRVVLAEPRARDLADKLSYALAGLYRRRDRDRAGAKGSDRGAVEKRHLAFLGTVAKIEGDASTIVAACGYGGRAEVERAADDLSVTLFSAGRPVARLAIDPATAKHLAHALEKVAFAIDPAPFAAGVSGGGLERNA